MFSCTVVLSADFPLIYFFDVADGKVLDVYNHSVSPKIQASQRRLFSSPLTLVLCGLKKVIKA